MKAVEKYINPRNKICFLNVWWPELCLWCATVRSSYRIYTLRVMRIDFCTDEWHRIVEIEISIINYWRECLLYKYICSWKIKECACLRVEIVWKPRLGLRRTIPSGLSSIPVENQAKPKILFTWSLWIIKSRQINSSRDTCAMKTSQGSIIRTARWPPGLNLPLFYLCYPAIGSQLMWYEGVDRYANVLCRRPSLFLRIEERTLESI